jgi:hypothetical protein
MDSPTTELWGAATYWGLNNGTESQRPQMLTRLFLSLYDFLTTSRDHEAAPISTPSLTCQTFGALLDNLEIEKLLPHSPEEIAGCGLDGVDRIYKAYFDAFGLSYHQYPRQQPSQKNSILLFRGSLFAHLDNLIRAYPSHMHNMLNNVLADDLLVDPMTDLPFVFKTIPLACFPTQDAVSVQLYNQRWEAFKPVRNSLVKEIKDTRQRAQNMAAMAHANMPPAQFSQGGTTQAQADGMALLARRAHEAQLMINASQRRGQEAIASAIW